MNTESQKFDNLKFSAPSSNMTTVLDFLIAYNMRIHLLSLSKMTVHHPNYEVPIFLVANYQSLYLTSNSDYLFPLTYFSPSLAYITISGKYYP